MEYKTPLQGRGRGENCLVQGGCIHYSHRLVTKTFRVDVFRIDHYITMKMVHEERIVGRETANVA